LEAEDASSITFFPLENDLEHYTNEDSHFFFYS
jgi:hypothetical protein